MQQPVLILGGTADARALAAALTAAGVDVVTSLAGRVSRPRLPAGDVRTGGFGGPDGLAAWLVEHGTVAVVDATHPFAERIGHSAVRAAAATRTPLLRLERPGWADRTQPGWRWVDTLDDAAATLAATAHRVFVTTGRQGLAAFAGLDAQWFLIRCVEPPDVALPRQHELLLSRGPYTVDGEAELLQQHRIDTLVTKDSGGAMTAAKLDAADALDVDVVVVRRPARPPVPAVATVDDAVSWVRETLAAPSQHPAR